MIPLGQFDVLDVLAVGPRRHRFGAVQGSKTADLLVPIFLDVFSGMQSLLIPGVDVLLRWVHNVRFFLAILNV